MFERFTNTARQVLVLAQEEARLLNHSFIGTEHLLLGLIHEGEGIGAKSLEALGVTLEGVRVKVEETIGMSESLPSESPPFTPRAKKVLELSLREALQLGHHYIGTGHLLLGIVREGEGVAATVLVSLGADLGQVRQQVTHVMSGHSGMEAEAGSGPIISTFGMASTGELGPVCPRCRAPVIEGARFRGIAVAPDQDDNLDPLPVVIVFCSRCGTTLAILSADAR